MKKAIIKALYLISIILIILFFITVTSDYINREKLITIDFKFAVKFRMIMFIIPGIISFGIGRFLEHKNKKSIEKEKK